MQAINTLVYNQEKTPIKNIYANRTIIKLKKSFITTPLKNILY